MVIFFLFFKVRASKQVTRSRRSSVWPIPFFGRLLTSQSETEAGPREESSPRGTEAVCPCSAPVGRSHTVDPARKVGRSAHRRRERWMEEAEGKEKELTGATFKEL